MAESFENLDNILRDWAKDKGQKSLAEALRAAPRKYQLDLEIAKKSNFSKLAQNEALRALVINSKLSDILNTILYLEQN